MNHEIITNELNENEKLLIDKVEKMAAEINKKDEELSSKEKELTSKDIEINNLKNELAYLKGIIANRNKKIFGASSEKVDTNQLSFFNETEKHSDSKVKEPELKEVTYKRAKKNSVTGKKDNLANLERVIKEL